MRILAVILVWCSAMVIAGCTGYPRFRGNDPVERPSRTTSLLPRQAADFSTSEFVRLGLILQSYLGKPYAGHSQYEPGIDCSLFTREVFNAYNKLQLPRTAAEQFRNGQPVARGDLRYGDLIFFKTDGTSISHVGVFLGYDSFIHASSSRGVIISQIDETYWARSYVGARRVLE